MSGRAGATGVRGWLARRRLPGEVSAVLGGALAWAVAGGLVALLGPPAVSAGSPLASRVLTATRGVALGWWGGIAWGVALALRARAAVPLPPAHALASMSATAAALAGAAGCAAHLIGFDVLAGAGLGLLAGTIWAAIRLGRGWR